jgi:hypothetical protein
MAKKKSSLNKSQVIRDYVAAHPEAKPKDVAAALTAQHGVEFTSQAVSMTKSNDKKKSGKTGRRSRSTKGSVTFLSNENGKSRKNIHVAFPAGGLTAFANAFMAAGHLIEQAGDLETASKILSIVAEVKGDQRGNG